MARRKKGADICGWFIVDKPAGPTSTAVVNKVRWALDARKAGHAGTLDPQATGVLAIALGEATKTIPYVTEALKAYTFTVRLGQSTNTDDAQGEVIAHSDRRPTDHEIKQALGQFVGNIEQIPPQFSAVRIDGERAYKMARAGQEVDIAPRPLWVEELVMTGRPDADHVMLEMICGKGGYVRAIARDLGAMLGCYGHVVDLRRIWSGEFDARDAVPFSRIIELGRDASLISHLQPLVAGLALLPQLRATDQGAVRLGHGNPGQVLPCDLEYGEEAWASYQDKPLAVGRYKSGVLHPDRVFNL